MKIDFPIFKRKINGKNLIYLDSGATSQKPSIVIEAEKYFYENHNANINRGIHTLGDEATRMYEDTRKKVSKFINANSKEIIFTKNATEGINLVARSFLRPKLTENDFILLTEMEHHANLIPWQIIAKEVNAKIEYVPVNEEGILDLKKAEELLSRKPKIFAFTHVSNVLGTINPARKLIEIAHSYDVPVLIDGAQSVPHLKVDAKELDCDFLVFSAHKMLGPTGVGVLYGKKELLDNMEVFMGGGDMIKEVYYDHFIPDEAPNKFEAGTPNIAGVAAFGKSIEYLEKLGMENVEKNDKELVKYAFEKLSKIKNLNIYGPKDLKLRQSLISFNCFTNNEKLIHPHDLATILDDYGIAIRAGHHCCMPLHDKLGLSATSRISFYIYNTKEDVDVLINALEEINKMFNKELEVISK